MQHNVHRRHTDLTQQNEDGVIQQMHHPDARNPQGQSFVLVLCETEEEARVVFDQGLRKALYTSMALAKTSCRATSRG